MTIEVRKAPLYKVLATKVAWQPTEHFKEQRLAEIQRCLQELPSGSGWNGTKILLDKTREDRLVLYGEFHHMNTNGYYDGWTQHEIIVTPSLTNEFDLRITGVNRNDIKDCLHEMFDYALREQIAEWDERKENAS